MSFSLAPWLDLLRCPADGSPLREESSALVCSACSARYPCAGGIVQFVQPDGTSLDDEQKVREMAARDADAAVYDAMFDTRRIAIEVPPCIAALNPQANDVIAELGAGTGRFTIEFAGRVARLVALDFSLRSLLLLRDRLTESMRQRTLLIQADACTLPLTSGVFTKAVSYDMLQHLPEAAMRQQVVSSASSLLVSGGTFTATMYHWSRQKQQAAARGEGDYTQRDGHHESGICYHNFVVPELREMWRSAGLSVDRMLGFLIGFPGARFLGPLQVPMNRVLGSTAWGIERSYQVLIRGKRMASGAA